MAAPRKNEADKAVKQTLSFDPVQFRELNEFCRQVDRSISYVVRKAIAEYLAAHKDDKPTEDGFRFKW